EARLLGGGGPGYDLVEHRLVGHAVGEVGDLQPVSSHGPNLLVYVQFCVPESVNVSPAIGTNFQSYDVGCNVSCSTPNVVELRASLPASSCDRKKYRLRPPVPAVIWRMPRCTAKRS